ncbi:MAG: hypothetical protein VW268_02715 [Rhodospirillaceae bacterium]
MVAPVRILHLTDLHMRRHLDGSANKVDRLSREMPAVLERLAAMVPALGVDVAVISGDLLDVPDEYIDGSLNDPAARADMAAKALADYRLFAGLNRRPGPARGGHSR